MFFVRQDPVEFTGNVVSVLAPSFGVGAPALKTWTIVVKPDSAFLNLLTIRNGSMNSSGTISCSIGIDEGMVNYIEIFQRFSAASAQNVRVVGTWCDDDDSGLTVIYPMGLLAIVYPITTYDISGWPVAVRDIDFLAFSHAADGLAALTDPHANDSRTLAMHLPFPHRPTDTAIPFSRAYKSTRFGNVVSEQYIDVNQPGDAVLEATVETGTRSQNQGFLAIQIGLTYEEPDLDNYCPPGDCEDDGKHCAHTGTFRFMRVPPHVPYALKGDLAISPGDGNGIISGIVASLSPNQVYDHMGIFIDNGQTIRHCTSSQDRMEEDRLYTFHLQLKILGGSVIDERFPLAGVRSDLLRFGWPGSVTQTVEEVYKTGRNTKNPQWSFATINAGQDTEDPDNPGKPFFLYQLPKDARERRLQFNDPEIDRGESVVRLQDTSVELSKEVNHQTEFHPMVIRPHAQFNSLVRPALERVADMAQKIKAHYRFFAYSKGDIGLDPAFTAPPKGSANWGTLSPGAQWPAGTIPAMCSSFIWTAVQLANQTLNGKNKIVLEDKADPADPATGLEYGVQDGLYQYHEQERQDAANNLVQKLRKKIRDKFESKLPGIAFSMQFVRDLRDTTAHNVSNQTANAFAFDACEKLDESWQKPGEGETASPDDTLNFWDVKPHVRDQNQMLEQPTDGLGVWGDAAILMLTSPVWKKVPLFRKQDTDLGTGLALYTASLNGTRLAGVTIRFDGGCPSVMTTLNREPVDQIALGTGIHFAEGFIVMPNPVTGNPETFRTAQALEFKIEKGKSVPVDLKLEPPSDLWRVIDVHLDADIHDRSFWGGDADSHHFIEDWHFELRQDLEDDPLAQADQQNTVLHFEQVWRTEPEVGSGVHVALSIIADLNTADRSIKCHCEVALIDTDSGGFLGIGTSSDVDQLEKRDVVVPADGSTDVLVGVNFSSDEDVPERAAVSLRLTNRRRPS